MNRLTAFVGGAAAALALAQSPLLHPGQEASTNVIRAQAFDVVDEDGNLAARISSNANGGTFELFRPGKDNEDHPFAFIGCNWSSGAEIVLSDPKGESKAKLFLSVDGKPAAASVSGYAPNGAAQFKLGSRHDDFPAITIWNTQTGESRFEK